jgi:hypothetical protein
MKNNTFKHTFYLGLLIIVIITGLLTALSFNIYKTLTNKILIKKQDSSVVKIPFTYEKEVIHDTIFVEKPIIKPIVFTTPKKETKLIQSKKIDTTSFNDSVIK